MNEFSFFVEQRKILINCFSVKFGEDFIDLIIALQKLAAINVTKTFKWRTYCLFMNRSMINLNLTYFRKNDKRIDEKRIQLL